MNRAKSSVRKAIFAIAAAVLLLLAGAGGYVCYVLFTPNFSPAQTQYIYIYPEKDFSDLCRQLQEAGCSHIESFRKATQLLNYQDELKTGRYAIHSGLNNYSLLKDLRRGEQAPVRITFNNIRLKEDLAERLSEQLMLDDNELLVLMNDSEYCAAMGFIPQTIKAMFIPNTYEVYWTISAEKLMQRMKQEFTAFWTPERLEKAENIHLSPVEVSVLASIVEEESAVADEYPVIAGLYINRLRKGIPLQADPTVKYAAGDFTLKRILDVHLRTDSPYNTYLHEGLPPGPLRVPSITALNATLNYKQHNYLYMCAKEDFSGRHNFAVTLAEHNRNAKLYHQALNKRNIR
ncbi:MAG: endolytic transglycosylase MltG [Tannerella sp.]|jgi:UPF0755 protein|nr:endolytic transglycosylase MltG [Tannerella sp.]